MPKPNPEVRCEYAEIARWTTKPNVIDTLSRTPVTEIEAKYLIKNQLPDCLVTFAPNARGMASVRNGQQWIELSANPITQEDVDAGNFGRRLQLAVVAHEIAHHVAGLNYSHDRFFTDSLDRISVLFLKTWKEIVEIERAKDEAKNKEIKSIEKHRQQSLREILAYHCPICGKEATQIGQFEEVDKTYAELSCGHLVIKEKQTLDFDWESFKSVDGDFLMNFQKESVLHFYKAQGRLICNDEMGLGKTPIGIAISRLFKLEPVICVVKAAVIPQWNIAWQYWTDDIDFVQVITSSKQFAISGQQVYIISYNLLSRLPNDYFDRVGAKLLIVDEVQMIKNDSTQMARSVTYLASKIPNVVSLSGTPIRNNASEYYTALHMTKPSLFPNKQRFIDNHINYYMTPSGFMKYTGLKNPENFKELTKDFIIRHTQKEVLPDLPEITRDFKFIEKTENEKYDAAMEEFLEYVEQKNQKDFSFFANILDLIVKMRHQVGLMKVPQTFEMACDFLESTDRKIAIFIHHHDVRDGLEKLFKSYCAENDMKPPLMFVSGMKPNVMMDAQDKFNFDPEYRIAILSTLSKGEGLNLQKGCSDIIIAERQFNPETQAEFRVKRIGQDANKITSTYPTMLGTIDEWSLELVQRKAGNLRNTLDFEPVDFSEDSVIMEMVSIIKAKGRARYRL